MGSVEHLQVTAESAQCVKSFLYQMLLGPSQCHPKGAEGKK